MNSSELVSLVMVPITLFFTVTGIFIGIGLGDKKNREKTIMVLQKRTLGAPRLEAFSQLWSSYFQSLFGKNLLSKRQVLTIPLFTLITSSSFFIVWIVYVYLFNNETGSLFVALPITMRQAVIDFYTKGVFATFFIVICAIQMTKVTIGVGRKRGYCSQRFYIMFILGIAATYFLFSIVVFLFRIEDMVRLYIEIAPNDPMPVMPYAPFSNMVSSLKLFQPQTMIHITSQGWFSTYFMPEPLIFYCAATAQASLLGITFSYQIATVLVKVKAMGIKFLTIAGTPETNATSIVVFIFVGLFSLPVVMLSIIAVFTLITS